ncbi:hypothetical protein HC028_13625 [Planosporangium flavigriseum]|uniref:Uncharacterized protein n=1 Tax=Planosporangium flavigriseum TaxID=373681 RepID=A0A8J3LQZ2_9ACTN|nr:hypothetical protein [Planosporangium flavigriseum]NJC65535.1 hypothetical protein [Planosporangium flavigriseum]GIG75028.1 hypothetical protein Pfl04_34320 [Planosporangium flavigriseum]
MTPYQPPKQSRRGQLIDAATMLALIFVTLFVTTFIVRFEAGNTASGTKSSPVKQLSELPLSDAERAQYQKMIDAEMVDLTSVNASVAAKQSASEKYRFSVLALLGTIVLLVGYLTFVYRTSLHEYREVIAEKFGPRYERAKP